MAFLLGPGIGGVLIAWVGAVPALWFTAVAFLASAVLVAAMRVDDAGRPAEHHAPDGFWSGTREGLRFVWRDHLLRALLITTAVLVSVYMPVEGVLLPVEFEAQDEPGRLGLVVMAMSLGGIAGALGYGLVGRRWRRSTVYRGALVLTGVFLMVLAALPPFGVMLAASVLIGVAYGPVGPLVNIAMQTRSPEHMRGRVVGIITSAEYAAGPFGYLIVGAATERFGVQPTFLAVGATVLAVAVAALAVRPLDELDRLPEPTEGGDPHGGTADAVEAALDLATSGPLPLLHPTAGPGAAAAPGAPERPGDRGRVTDHGPQRQPRRSARMVAESSSGISVSSEWRAPGNTCSSSAHEQSFELGHAGAHVRSVVVVAPHQQGRLADPTRDVEQAVSDLVDRDVPVHADEPRRHDPAVVGEGLLAAPGRGPGTRGRTSSATGSRRSARTAPVPATCRRAARRSAAAARGRAVQAPPGAQSTSRSKRSGNRTPRRNTRFPPRRATDRDGMRRPQLVDHRDEDVLVPRERVAAVRLVGLAAAGQVDHDDAVLRRQQRDHGSESLDPRGVARDHQQGAWRPSGRCRRHVQDADAHARQRRGARGGPSGR